MELTLFGKSLLLLLAIVVFIIIVRRIKAFFLALRIRETERELERMERRKERRKKFLIKYLKSLDRLFFNVNILT